MWIFLLKVADFMVTENIEAMQKKRLPKPVYRHTHHNQVAGHKESIPCGVQNLLVHV